MVKKCKDCIFVVYDYGSGYFMCRLKGIVENSDAETCMSYTPRDGVAEILKIIKEALKNAG